MNDLTHLTAEIIENSNDDTVRLAFADELQARGEPGDEQWAELIRLQIAEHAGSGGLTASVRIIAAMSVYAEPGVHQRRWLGGVRNVVPDSADWLDTYSWWSRGFPKLVQCDSLSFAKYGGTFLWNRNRDEPCSADHRPIRQVTLTTYPEFVGKLIASPDFSIYPKVCGQIYRMPHDATEKEILEKAFPGVKFVLPGLLVEVAVFEPPRAGMADPMPQTAFYTSVLECAGFVRQGQRLVADGNGRVRPAPRDRESVHVGVAMQNAWESQQ